MNIKKVLVMVLAMLLVVSAAVFAGGEDESAGGKSNVKADVDYDSLSMAELYELAKQEGGTVKVYATTTDASTAINKFKKQYPDIAIEYIHCDNSTVASKIEMEFDTGNINADVLMVKDNSGEIFHEMVQYDYIDIYRPEAVTKHIDDKLLEFGLPLYSTFNPWYYNTKMFPDGVPITSWWDIVQGYDTTTGSYYDANGVNHQYWTVYTKDVTAQSYCSLWCQLIIDADKVEEAYEKEFGKPLEYTYHGKLKNTPGVMEFPENNAGVELFYRFTQMKMTELSDGDGVVDAVDQSINGPTLGLCSASKLDNADMGMNVAWVIGIEPYTAFQSCVYSYLVSGLDNPAGSRLFINFFMGGEDGQSGCYNVFDKRGSWSVRDDVTFVKNGFTVEQVNLTEPDFDKIYDMYMNVKGYFTLWRSYAKD